MAACPQLFLLFAFFQNYFRFFDLKKTQISVIILYLWQLIQWVLCAFVYISL